MSAQKIPKSIIESFKTALMIFLCFGMIPTVTGVWRYFWTCWEIKRNHIAQAEAVCIAVEEDETNESYRRDGFRPIYDLILSDGTVVAVYQDTIKENFPSADDFRQIVASGNTMRFTYVPKAIFTNGAYVLLSVSDHGSEILGFDEVVKEYRSRVKTCIIMQGVVSFVALLFVVVPSVLYLMQRWKKAIRRRRKRQKKLEQRRRNQTG